MSRLPRPHSSPDPKISVPSLKRKAIPEEDDLAEQPAAKKGAGVGTGFRPRPLQSTTNAAPKPPSAAAAAKSTPAVAMPRLTRPKAPAAARPTAATSKRGTSAPPASTITMRKPSSGLPSRAPAGARRVPSGSSSAATTTAAAPDVLTHLHKRIATLEDARTMDTERLTTLFENAAAASTAVGSNSSGSAAPSAELQQELITAQVQLAGTTAQLSALQSQLATAQSQVGALQLELGSVKGALRASDEREADIRKEVLALKGEVLAGKTAEAAARDAASDLQRELRREREEGEIRVRRGERLLREAKDECEALEGRVSKLRAELAGAASAEVGLQERYRALAGRAEVLQGEVVALQQEKAAWALEREAFRAEQVRGEEERRLLHGMVMELKGNIRVFCRVRPVLPFELPEGEGEGAEAGAVSAQIAYPDAGTPYPSGQKEIVLSSTGAEREWDAGMGNKPRKEVWGFGFDRVFGPRSTQADLFKEISQLAQSCTDGYNVCIFAYGQTGSGKSWTMEGGSTEETQGMIPRAVAQVFRVAEDLKDKGWTYTMEGQFLEIYNETITDLLAPSLSPSSSTESTTTTTAIRKHEIHHHPVTHLTTVSDVRTPRIASPAEALALLAAAQKRRRVAATGMNERSSRSHSVFTLRIRGVHEGGEERVGTLNLVDLAGSERLGSLAHGAAASSLGVSTIGMGKEEKGERLKETQNINKSLSALGDVIAALGAGAGSHVPYRNSKLTYLLQNSLSGNSKTLMVLNLSPLAAHLNESLTSLRFATKVNNTTIGTAKKVQVQGTGAK